MLQNYDDIKFEEASETEEERAVRLNRLRAAEIAQQLKLLDSKAIRPLRAILAGAPTDEDKDKLCKIEEQAVALRGELAELGGGD